MTHATVLIHLLESSTNACSVAWPEWFLPEDGAFGVPTNTLILSGGWFSELGLWRADDGVDVPVEPVESTLAYVDGFAPVVRRPVQELLPDTQYAIVLDGRAVTRFVTGDGPSAEAPEPPEILGVEHDHIRRRDTCGGRGGRYLHFTIAGSGELLLTGVDGAFVDPERPFEGSGIYDGTVFLAEEQEIIHPGSALGDEVRFGFVDATGAWSGWSEGVDPGGCGCCAGAPGGRGAWVALLLPLGVTVGRAGGRRSTGLR